MSNQPVDKMRGYASVIKSPTATNSPCSSKDALHRSCPSVAEQAADIIVTYREDISLPHIYFYKASDMRILDK